jgi:hypothetical protein
LNHQRTFLYLWNPKKWNELFATDAKAKLTSKGKHTIGWRSNRKDVSPGDRFFIARIIDEPGIFGSGTISRVVKATGSKKFLNYLTFDTIYDVKAGDPHIPIAAFKGIADIDRLPQGSGTLIDSNVAIELERQWSLLSGNQNLSLKPYQYCVYTIKHSTKVENILRSGNAGFFKERRSWRGAKRMLLDASKEQQKLPIVFAAAESTENLIAAGYIDEIVIDGETTTYFFSELRQFSQPQPRKTDLKLRSTGKYLSVDYIRPYAICQSPAFLQDQGRFDTDFDDTAYSGPPEKIPAEEGGRRTITVTAIERKKSLRDACIAKWGAVCQVCAFDFGKTFGSVAKGFIHVHHHNLLADSGIVSTDPEKDMSPLCPNCHAVAHLKRPPYTVEELRTMRR